MSKKVIKMTLSTDSIDKAIRQLKEYQLEMDLKIKRFVDELVQIGVITIEEHKYSTGSSDYSDLEVIPSFAQGGSGIYHADVTFKGKEVAFIEFGAGVYYNGGVGTGTRFGIPRGLTIGSYGLGQGRLEVWKYKDKSTGEVVWTHGTKATQALEYADDAMHKRIEAIAREVFG